MSKVVAKRSNKKVTFRKTSEDYSTVVFFFEYPCDPNDYMKQASDNDCSTCDVISLQTERWSASLSSCFLLFGSFGRETGHNTSVAKTRLS